VSKRAAVVASAGIILVVGLALAAATWIAHSHAWAVGVAVFAVTAAAVVGVIGRRDSDLATALRGGGDERQVRSDRDATALAGLLMIVAALIGAVVTAFVSNGDPGPFGVICAVGAVGYIVGRVVFRH
jgi:hypothetical protein